MRILCIIDCLGSGGAQRQMTYLACGLQQRGHAVELFLTHPHKDHFRPAIEMAGIPIHSVERGGRTGFSLNVLGAIRRLLGTGFDAIVSFQLSANGYAVLARMTTRRFHGRVVSGERTAAAGTKGRTKRIAVWVTALLSDTLVANSHAHGRYMSALPGLSHKVRVIWNGYPAAGQPNLVCQSDDPERPLLLVVARRSAEKNGVRLFQALRIVYERYGWTPRLRWAGVQQNDEASQRMNRAMDAFLRDNPYIAAHCELLGEVKDVQALYRSSDALILPSLFEGLPNVVCEAMMAGCPVIASDVCDHPALLGSEERGLLFDPLTPESIAGAIQRFAAMSHLARADMAARARDFAAMNLGLEPMIDQYEELINGNALLEPAHCETRASKRLVRIEPASENKIV